MSLVTITLFNGAKISLIITPSNETTIYQDGAERICIDYGVRSTTYTLHNNYKLDKLLSQLSDALSYNAPRRMEVTPDD